MFAIKTRGRPDGARKDKVKRIQKKNRWGKGKTDKVRPIQYEKNLSVCEEIALELNVQGGLGKVHRKSQTCLQHALSYVDKQENFKEGRHYT